MISKKSFRLSDIPPKLFYILLCWFPIFIPIRDSFTKYGKNTYGNLAIGYIICLTLFSLFVILCKDEKLSKRKEAVLLCSLFFISILIRVFWIPIFKTLPISDFLQAHEVAQMGRFPAVEFSQLSKYQIYYKQFPSWGGWMLTLKLFYKIFGADIVVGQLVNVFISSLTVVLIYITAKNITNSYRTAVIAASLFAFWPAMIIYTGVLTPEHFVNFAFMLTLLCLSYAHKYRQSRFKLSVILYVLAGLSAGFLQMYKAISAILIVAFLITEIFFCWLPDLYDIIKKNKKFLQCLKRASLVSVSFIFSYLLFVQVFYFAFSSYIGTKIETLTYASMYMGLDVDSGGTWSKQTTDLRNRLIVEYQDMDKVNDTFKEMVKNKVSNNIGKYNKFFEHKANIEWSSYFPENDLFKCASTNKGKNTDEAAYFSRMYSNLTQRLGNISAHHYYFIMFFAAIACIGYVFKKNNYSIFFASLYIFGLALTMLISEAQQRYKTIVYAPLCILAAVGFGFFFEFITKLSKKGYEFYLSKCKNTQASHIKN